MAVAACVMAVSLGSGTASGQAAPPAGPANQLVLTAQTAWVASASNGDFHMGLSITAADPGNTRLEVIVHERLTSRSDFNESLAGRIHTSPRHFFPATVLTSLQPDLSGTYGVDVPVNASASASGGDSLFVSTPGVYPVEVTLIDRNGRTLTQLVTHLLLSLIHI